jgi:predicted Zn finger-like uncharacterized protein
MLTRCPHCQTAFRVTPDQLKVRQGRVRCGTCGTAFNALDSLADEALPVIPAPPENTAPATTEPPDSEMPAPTPPPPPEPKYEPEPEPEVEPEPEPEQDSAPPPQTLAVHEPPLPEEWRVAAPATPPPTRRWPWIMGILALLMLAGGQLLYIYRVELAVLAPAWRPTLVAACHLAGCTVPLPHKPELLGIETSDLAPAPGDHLLLTATLKNRALFAQEYPHLELTLTDTQDTALLRKVLTPADYLPADRKPASGFAARSELSLKLTFEARGVPAIGYRLYLFYP